MTAETPTSVSRGMVTPSSMGMRASIPGYTAAMHTVADGDTRDNSRTPSHARRRVRWVSGLHRSMRRYARRTGAGRVRACSWSRPRHLRRPAVSCATGRLANICRSAVGPSAAPLRPPLRMTPSSLAKPGRAIPGSVLGVTGRITWCQRPAAGSPGEATRPHQPSITRLARPRHRRAWR